MKKIFLSLFVIALSAIIFISCSKSDDKKNDNKFIFDGNSTPIISAKKLNDLDKCIAIFTDAYISQKTTHSNSIAGIYFNQNDIILGNYSIGEEGETTDPKMILFYAENVTPYDFEDFTRIIDKSFVAIEGSISISKDGDNYKVTVKDAWMDKESSLFLYEFSLDYSGAIPALPINN